MIIKAPPDERRLHQSDALDEFASSQFDEERSGHESTLVRGRAPEGAATLEGPPLVPVYLAESEGLDAFDREQPAEDEPAQVAQGRVALPGLAATDMAAAGSATAIIPTPARTTATAPRVNAARRVSSPVVLRVEIPRPTRLPAYLYAAVFIAILMVLTAGLLTRRSPVPEPSSADQPVPTQKDALAALSTKDTPDLITAVPSAPLGQGTRTRPIERSRIAGLAPPTQPVPQRVAPASSARAERQTKPTGVARPSLPFPASQTRSVSVPATTVAPGLTAGAATNAEAAVPPPRSAVALPVAASAPAASSAAGPSPPAPAPAAAATPAPATASSTPTPVSAAITGESAPVVTPTPAAATPPNAAPAASALDIERGAIRQVLERYRTAVSALDAAATQEAWPGVNQRALARAFERLDAQDVSFQNCRINVNSAEASAVCGGLVRYVPRIGSRTQRVEQREWTFRLRRQDSGWFIEGVGTQ